MADINTAVRGDKDILRSAFSSLTRDELKEAKQVSASLKTVKRDISTDPCFTNVQEVTTLAQIVAGMGLKNTQQALKLLRLLSKPQSQLIRTHCFVANAGESVALGGKRRGWRDTSLYRPLETVVMLFHLKKVQAANAQKGNNSVHTLIPRRISGH